MKKKKLVKQALKNPHLYSDGELNYFELWLNKRKKEKEQKKILRKLELEKNLLL
jgi:hypothetical protein